MYDTYNDFINNIIIYIKSSVKNSVKKLKCYLKKL